MLILSIRFFRIKKDNKFIFFYNLSTYFSTFRIENYIQNNNN